jgi:hypothetical protein
MAILCETCLPFSHKFILFPFRRELDENMDSVIMNGHWNGLEKSVATFKTPTHLLLNEKREFEAFGYEAEKRYSELYQQGRHQRCYFFRRFKTKLTSQVAKNEIIC